MNGFKWPCAVIAASLAITLGSVAAASTAIVRVDGDAGSASPAANGGGWGADAFKYLQDAIDEAESLLLDPVDPPTLVEIRVATTSVGNPYRPDRSGEVPGGSGDVAATFKIPANVWLLGGYSGVSDDDRDATGTPSVLSGQLTGGSRSLNIVIADETGVLVDDQLVLDGFVVTGAQGIDGAGMRATGTDNRFFVARSRFTGNRAARGAGFEARGSGGGFDPLIVPKAVILSSRFDDNEVTNSGGAIINANASVTVYSSLFHDNRSISLSPNASRGNGGAITNGSAAFLGGNPELTIVNCTFADNIAQSGEPGGPEVGKGGAIYQKLGSMSIINSIFWGNSHNCPDMQCTLSDPDVVARQQIYDETTFQFTGISHSVVEDTSPGDGLVPFGGNVILDVDPLFENPAAGDYRLQFVSSAIDFGDDAAVTAEVYRDRFDFDGDFDFDEPAPELDGRPRRLDDHVDAGAYEQLVETCIADIDGDAQVDFDDLLRLLASFGPCPTGPCDADLDGDGQVAFSDLLILLAAFGPCNPDGSPAPEGIADCIARIGFNDPEKLAACIEAMTMAGTP